MEKTIFISYCHLDSASVDKIEQDLRPLSLKFHRDIRDIELSGSIKDFMNLIKTADYVMLILSDNYFKSQYCMYEILELFTLDNYREKIIPIRLKDLIIKNEELVNYLAYWEKEIKRVNEMVKNNLESIEGTHSIASKIELYRKIRINLDSLSEKLFGLGIEDLDHLRTTKYDSLLKKIGLKDEHLLGDVLKVQSMIGENQDLGVSELVRKYPNHNKVLFLKAYTEANKGHHANAIFYYNEILKTERNNDSVYLNLGIAYFALQDYEQAEKSLEKSLNLNHTNALAYYYLAELHALDLNDSAIVNYKKSIEFNPNQFYAYYGLGKLHKKEKKYKEAIDNFLKAVNLDNNNEGILLTLSETYEKIGDVTSAYHWLWAANQLNPYNQTTLLKMAQMHNEQQGYATTEHEKAIESPNEKTIYSSIHEKESKRAIKDEYLTIKSPMIGTFYKNKAIKFVDGSVGDYYDVSGTVEGYSNEPFVKEGDKIEIGQVLYVIEAMCLFNHIESEVSGYIEKVLVDDKTPVEYDQPLFILCREQPIDMNEFKKKSDKYLYVIKSPLIGRFFRSPKVIGCGSDEYSSTRYPGEYSEGAPFVNVGDEIKIGNPVCCITCMGLVNEVESEMNGFVAKILVSDAEDVEYDQPLFLVSDERIK